MDLREYKLWLISKFIEVAKKTKEICDKVRSPYDLWADESTTFRS